MSSIDSTRGARTETHFRVHAAVVALTTLLGAACSATTNGESNGPTMNGGSQRPASASADLFQQCGGTTFHPNNTCRDGRCAPAGLAADVYKEWKRQFLTRHGMQESAFASRIEVSKVELTDGPLYVWWRVEYVFSLDWVRSRQSDSVQLGNHPLAATPDAAAISRAVAMRIPPAIPLDLNMHSVVPRTVVESALRSCDPGLKPDWCQIQFDHRTGRLIERAFGVVNERENRCKAGGVDVATGGVTYCVDALCRVS